MSKKLQYDELPNGPEFREQFRFLFSAAIIATVFVVPDNNELLSYLKFALSVSAIFAGLYLVLTAATVKYSEPRWLYQIIYTSERFRMRMYDYSVNILAIAFLYFLSILTLGTLNHFGVKLEDTSMYVFILTCMFIIGILFLVPGLYFEGKTHKAKKKIPRV